MFIQSLEDRKHCLTAVPKISKAGHTRMGGILQLLSSSSPDGRAVTKGPVLWVPNIARGRVASHTCCFFMAM